MIQRLRAAYNALKGVEKVKEVVKPVYKVLPYDVTQKQLGSINRQEVRYTKSMTVEEYAEHISDIAIITSHSAFKREIESLIDTQVYWMAEQALGNDQIQWGKGTVNGFNLVLERFDLLRGEHLKKTQPYKEFDKHKIIADEIIY